MRSSEHQNAQLSYKVPIQRRSGGIGIRNGLKIRRPLGLRVRVPPPAP